MLGQSRLLSDIQGKISGIEKAMIHVDTTHDNNNEIDGNNGNIKQMSVVDVVNRKYSINIS